MIKDSRKGELHRTCKSQESGSSIFQAYPLFRMAVIYSSNIRMEGVRRSYSAVTMEVPKL